MGMKTGGSLAGMACIVAAAILWGTTGTSQALAPTESTPQVIGALRLVVGGVALALLSVVRNGWRLFNMPLLLAGGAGMFVALYQLAFFWGVSLTGVAVGTMVGIGSSPVFAGVVDAVFMGRPPDRKWYLATALALVGCIILLSGSGKLTVDPTGVCLAGAAGLSYAVYTMLMKKLLVGRPADTVAAVVFCAGALFLLPLLFGADLSWLKKPAGFSVIIHLGVLATALSYFLFCRGLEHVYVSTAVTLSLAEPFTAGMLGLLVLGERLSAPGMVGLALILSGLVVLAVPVRPATLSGSR